MLANFIVDRERSLKEFLGGGEGDDGKPLRLTTKLREEIGLTPGKNSPV